MCSSVSVRIFPSRFVRFRCDVRGTRTLPLVVGVAMARRVEVAYETSEQRLVYLDLLASQHVNEKTVKCTNVYQFFVISTVVSCSVWYWRRIVKISWESCDGKLGKTYVKVGNILTCNTLSVYVGDATLPDCALLRRSVEPGCQAGEERFNAMWFGSDAAAAADSWMLVVR